MVAASLATRAVASSRSMKISADIRASLGEEAILGPMFPCRCDGHHKMSCGREYPPLLRSAVWPRSCDASASETHQGAPLSLYGASYGGGGCPNKSPTGGRG